VTDAGVHIRGWGAVTTLGWSATESARNLISGQVPPAGVCSSSHLTTRDFKAFEIAYNGNPLEKSLAMLDASVSEAFERAELSKDEIAESCLLVGTTGGLFIRNEFAFTESVRLNPDKASPSISCRNRGPGEVTQFIAEKFQPQPVLAHNFRPTPKNFPPKIIQYSNTLSGLSWSTVRPLYSRGRDSFFGLAGIWDPKF